MGVDKKIERALARQIFCDDRTAMSVANESPAYKFYYDYYVTKPLCVITVPCNDAFMQYYEYSLISPKKVNSVSINVVSNARKNHLHTCVRRCAMSISSNKSILYLSIDTHKFDIFDDVLMVAPQLQYLKLIIGDTVDCIDSVIRLISACVDLRCLEICAKLSDTCWLRIYDVVAGIQSVQYVSITPTGITRCIKPLLACRHVIDLDINVGCWIHESMRIKRSGDWRISNAVTELFIDNYLDELSIVVPMRLCADYKNIGKIANTVGKFCFGYTEHHSETKKLFDILLTQKFKKLKLLNIDSARELIIDYLPTVDIKSLNIVPGYAGYPGWSRGDLTDVDLRVLAALGKNYIITEFPLLDGYCDAIMSRNIGIEWHCMHVVITNYMSAVIHLAPMLAMSPYIFMWILDYAIDYSDFVPARKKIHLISGIVQSYKKIKHIES